MAEIRVKRAATATANLKGGELGVIATDLYFGKFANGDTAAGATKLANQNADNAFTQINTFQHATSDTVANVLFKNTDGTTTFYQAYGGRLQTASSFTFGATDLVDKDYVDTEISAAVQGLNIKNSVTVATITSLGITTSGQNTISGITINGVSLLSGDRILVKDEATPKWNGIYEVLSVITNAVIERADDMGSSSEFISAFTFVEEGSLLSDTGWVCTVNDGFTMDADDVTWSQFSGAGSYTADESTLHLDGTIFSIKALGVGATELEDAYGDNKNPYATKAAGFVLAAATSGGGIPAFRALAAGDIPTLTDYVLLSGATQVVNNTGDFTIESEGTIYNSAYASYSGDGIDITHSNELWQVAMPAGVSILEMGIDGSLDEYIQIESTKVKINDLEFKSFGNTDYIYGPSGTGDPIIIEFDNGLNFKKATTEEPGADILSIIPGLTTSASTINMENANFNIKNISGTTKFAITGSTGEVTTGIWKGTAIADGYIASATAWNAKLDSSGTIATDDYARFDASGDLIGRTFAEVRGDISTTIGANLMTIADGTEVKFIRINADETVSALTALTFRGSIEAVGYDEYTDGWLGLSPLGTSNNDDSFSLKFLANATYPATAGREMWLDGTTLNLVANTTIEATGFNGPLTGDVTGNVSGTAANVTGVVVMANGGTGFSSYAKGDIIYASATDTLSKRAAGTDGHFLKLVSGTPTWAADNNDNTTYTFASGTTNGAFNVTPSGGSAQSVAIYGLGSAAYTTTKTLISEAEIDNNASATARLISGSRFQYGIGNFNLTTAGEAFDFGVGTVSAGYYKTLNIGTGVLTTTADSVINIGPTEIGAGGSLTTNINDILITSGIKLGGAFYKLGADPTDTTGSVVNAVKYDGWLYATQFEGTIDGGVAW